MHHRRAASDTAMFKRLAPAEAKKEGSSSSQGSRSATPLVSSLLKPAGKFYIVSFLASTREKPSRTPDCSIEERRLDPKKNSSCYLLSRMC